MSFIYPPKMLRAIKTAWDRTPVFSPTKSTPSTIPSQKKLQELLEVAYQVSLLTEEQRRVRFRISYCDPTSMKTLPGALLGSRTIRFVSPRPFSVSEILQLAPAADSTQILIGVFDKPKVGGKALGTSLCIWGMVDTGHSWWEFTRGESRSGLAPPDYFTISSNEPGGLTISRAGYIVLTLRRGNLVTPMSGVFNSGPIGKHIAREAEKFHSAVCKELGVEKYDPQGHGENYPQQYFVDFIERILRNVQQRKHGGVILVVPDELGLHDTRLTDRVLVKYPCDDNRSWTYLLQHLCCHHKYYDRYFKATALKKIPQDKMTELGRLEYENEQALNLVRDQARFSASLTAVDGALVIAASLRVIGFGAEIIVPSPTLQYVRLADDISGTRGEQKPIDSFGTRHRSALRFCSSYEDSIAFIVSQDGDIRTAKRIGSDVIMWSGIDIGSFGL